MNRGESVNFITGRAKCGKTHEILSRIAENERRCERSLLIVPSGSTFEYEKRLAAFCSGGFMYTTVCGFYRLGELILSEAGLENAFITQQGRVMVIRRSIENAELSIFKNAAKKAGFALMCDDVISNFVTCELTSDEVLKAAENASVDVILKEKMTDLGNIYKLTEEYLEETGQQLRAACERICEIMPKSKFCNAHVYIDGIENPGEQTYRMFEALLDSAKSVTVALRCENKEGFRVFDREYRIYSRLRSVVKENGFGVNISHKTRENRYESMALEYMEKELWRFPTKKFAGDSSCIELYAAASIRAEVENLAAAVLEKSREGVRFRNMAIVAADQSKYDVIIKSIFNELGIPIFTDNKLKLSATSPAKLIRSALACVSGGYKARDVISLMKTGIAGVSTEESEKLENYILETGVSGNDFLSPFTYGKIPDTAQDTREKIITPLREMQSAIAYGTAAEKADAIMDYLLKLEVDKHIEETAEQFKKKGKLVLSKQYSQVWSLICEIMKQLKNVMGNSKLATDKLSNIIEEGLSADIIGIIPAGVDMLNYSGVTSALPNDIEYVFIVGAISGDFPTLRKDDKIIDDAELESLKDSGLNVWLSVQSKCEQDEANIYAVMTAPTKGLYMSYPISVGGEYTQPAFILSRLCGMLERPCAESSKYKLMTRESFAAYIRELADGKSISDKERMYVAWYMKNEKSVQDAEKLVNALFFSPSPSPIDRDLTYRLYQNRIYGSATRLEEFNSCPFRHFMSNGMRAVPRKVFKVAKADEGSFCHEIIDAFVRYVVENNIDYKSLAEKECDSITDKVAEPIITEFGNGIFTRSIRQKIKAQYLMDLVRDTVRAMVYHMQKGKFRFLGSELKFGFGEDCTLPALEVPLENGKVLSISGKIDRVDSYSAVNGENNLRIIDYKKGGMDFDFTELYEGLKLQLPLYLEAATRILPEAVGCGMYYMPMKKGHDEADDPDKLKDKIKSSFKLKGIMVEDEEIIIATDGNNKLSRNSQVVSMRKISGDMNNALPRENLDAIRRFAIKKAKKTAERILCGEITVSPYKSGKKNSRGEDITACQYCKLRTVCLFDEKLVDCKFRKMGNPKFNEIFEC